MFTPCLRRFAATCCAVLALASCQESSAPDDPAEHVAQLSPVSSALQSATVGDTVADLPVVIAKDAQGRPLSDVLVTFSIMSGGGTLTRPWAISGKDGRASLAGWHLGPKPGLNVVAASAGTRDTVLFSVNTVAGPPYRVAKVAGDDQRAAVGTATGVRPRVMVSDAWGNGLPGITVTFTVEAGGGTLNSSDAISDSAGIAESGTWILGSLGAQQLVARAAGLASEPFRATAVVPPMLCPASNTLKAGIPSASQLSAVSCQSADGRLFETFSVIVTEMRAYVFTMTSGEFDTDLELRTWDQRILATNNDHNSQTNSEFKVFLPAGEYVLVASSAKPTGAGKYTVSFHQPASSGVETCEPVFIVRGVTTQQAVNGHECSLPTFELYERFLLYLEAGESVSLQVDDLSYSGPTVELISPAGEQRRGEQDGFYVVKLNYVATVTGYYMLHLGLQNDNGMEYRLIVR